MKKILGLFIILLSLSGCTTGVTEEVYDLANEEVGLLGEQVDDLSAELEELEETYDLLTEGNSILEEELAIANEALAQLERPDEEAEALDDDEVAVENRSYSLTGSLTGAYDGQTVLEAGNDLLWALQLDDMAVVASYMNPINPTYFSPSQNFVRNNLVTLSPADVIGMATDTSLYTWGTERVSGVPITMTISDYFDQYVYDELYTQAPIIGQNIVVSTSTVPNDVQDNFFYSIYNVEYLLPELYTANANGEWRSLTLSFIVEGPHPELIAVIYGY